MAPGIDTEFASYFCAGIGPLQLGIVLVSRTFNFPFPAGQKLQVKSCNYNSFVQCTKFLILENIVCC